jgi:polyisoprenyl-teichoic acid--peptidoglycan teichoic acid transferase
MANSVGRFPKGSKGAYRDRNFTPPRKPKRVSPFQRGFVWGATVSLTAAISSIVGASIALVSPSSLNLSQLFSAAKFPQTNSNPQTSNEGLEILRQHTLTRPVNILVMGIDPVRDVPKGTPESFAGRSDTILLMRFDPSDRSVRLLSIPRDSRVEIPGVGYDKINEANTHGGPAFASRVVSRSLNDVVIDRYVRVTTEAFRELVDLIGGVEVLVPYSMSYRDLSQNLEINLQAGWQTLNGDQAEQFVRFRKDKLGDIERVQRQQVLLKALQKRLYSPAMLPRLPQAIRIFQQYVDTNLTLDEMLALASFGRDLEEQNIRMVMLPGSFSQSGEEEDKNAWIIDRGERDRLIDDYFNRASQVPLEMREAHQLRIAIQNATNDPGLGNRAMEYLAQKDFQNVYLAQESSELLQETEIVVQKGNLEAANSLKSLLGTGRVESLSVGDPDSDLTIRIGLDAKQLLAGDSFLRDTSPLTSPGNENP